ncbi:hypothetical protein N3K66_000173 [Trichothecium roseum]|uniref:Uncharacterized protein n=1 Tax=Trichothecium roseum TaxID=47278 RepID=A0ACC0VBS2_9HYPO|nr:hypothetical protein N3K66_000173 [Trichothecium roseum]
MFRNMNPGLSRRFPIDRPFRFNNFSLNQLSMIMRHEMREQDPTAAEGAMNATEDVLERALMRPRFSNAGEVMAILNAAKMNYEKRQSQLPDHQQTYDGVIEAVDIDPEFDRATRPDFNFSKMLGGRVNASIITKLTSYQKRCLGARRLGFNPREYVPTNFVFKGYPGTGKTTTAKSMGQIFYDMGFLSSTEVVECAATDLLGQYVGQTAPKTREKLEKGLGRVILLDEAYRLRSGQYAAEAVDELVKFLTQPTNVGKMIVILAGNTAYIDNLIRVRPELSSLFPEEIVFNNIPPADCITLLEREPKLENIEGDDDFLGNPFSSVYVKVTRLFRVLQLIPGWSNARDVKNLAKQIVGGFLEAGCVVSRGARTVSAELVINRMTECIAQKKGRLTLGYVPDSVHPPPSPRRCAEPHPGEAQEKLAYTQRGSPPPTISDICVQGITGGPNMVCAPQGEVTRATPVQSRNRANPPDAQDRNSLDVDVDRSNARNSYLHDHPHKDDNADDQGGNEAGHHSMVATEGMQASLRQGQKAEKALRPRQKSQLDSLQRALDEAYRESPQVDTQGSRPGDDGLGTNPTARDRLWKEMTILQRKIREQEQAQQALQKMGRYYGNFDWIKVPGGYLCSAAVCYVTDDELHRFMR